MNAPPIHEAWVSEDGAWRIIRKGPMLILQQHHTAEIWRHKKIIIMRLNARTSPKWALRKGFRELRLWAELHYPDLELPETLPTT